MMFSAVAPKCMRNPWVGEEEGSSGTSSGGPSKLEEPWAALSERSLVVMVEQLFSHLLKVLNICAHVLDDTPPGPAMKVRLIRRVIWFNRLRRKYLAPCIQVHFTTSLIHRMSDILCSVVAFYTNFIGHSPLPEQHPLPQSHS